MQIVFFGSFQEYSVIVLEKLLITNHYNLVTVVTTPPAPAGRHLQLKPTAVQLFAEKHNIPVFTPENLGKPPPFSPDFVVVAGYAKLLPPTWLDLPKIMAVNLHPSLLPAYRGPNPAEWAILNGETETGVTLIKMSAQFDTGEILTQKSLSIDPHDTRLSLYNKLYHIGAGLLVETLPQIASGEIVPVSQISSLNSHLPYARRITRRDGFVEFEKFKNFLELGAYELEITRKLKAFAGWPGVWTINPTGKRIKLVSLEPLLIQVEGKKATSPSGM